VRYFVSTGEPSGESAALLLIDAIRAIDPQAQFEGIGTARMRAAGVSLWRDTTGWASMGPAAAIPKIPKLLAAMLGTAFHVAASKPDLVVLVDFGVFNLRLANQLRRMGYSGPILDLFPPGTWLDNPNRAHQVSAVVEPVTAFRHQYDFYRSVGARVHFFGHPLTNQYTLRPPRSAPPGGGTIALLPGSRRGELRHHLPVFAQAYRVLQQRRPALRGVFGAADERAAATIAGAINSERLENVTIVRGVAAALADADGAWVASGTAVLEVALAGVPAVALYVISRSMVWYGRRMIRHRFITPPNLVLGREIVPELLQEAATPERLAGEIDRLMRDPSTQAAGYVELRAALGPADALERCAQYAVDLARAR
jgi:lipid-A-disaccharide synthase